MIPYREGEIDCFIGSFQVFSLAHVRFFLILSIRHFPQVFRLFSSNLPSPNLRARRWAPKPSPRDSIAAGQGQKRCSISACSVRPYSSLPRRDVSWQPVPGASITRTTVARRGKSAARKRPRLRPARKQASTFSRETRNLDPLRPAHGLRRQGQCLGSLRFGCPGGGALHHHPLRRARPEALSPDRRGLPTPSGGSAWRIKAAR